MNSSRISLWPLANLSVSLVFCYPSSQIRELTILSELGVERDDSGFAKLAKKAAREGKPLDKTSLPGKGCPFAGGSVKGRESKL